MKSPGCWHEEQTKVSRRSSITLQVGFCGMNVGILNAYFKQSQRKTIYVLSTEVNTYVSLAIRKAFSPDLLKGSNVRDD